MPTNDQVILFDDQKSPPFKWGDAPAGTPAATVTNETTWGINPTAGVATAYAREDHTHGTPAQPQGGGTPADTVTGETSFGASSNAGAATTYSRGDHTHGTPADPVPAHEVAYSHALLHSNALDHSNSLDHANTNDPGADEKAALAGTSGVPSATNKYVTDSDARNTNARAPTAHDNAAHSTAMATATELGTHAGLTTGTHGVGASTVESASGSQGKVDTHAALATGVHGAGASTLATAANITTHAGVTASVHGFDASGNAPAQAHDNARHSAAYALASDLSTHTGAATPHTGHVQVAGQIGGTAASPDVRGVRETSGPTLLTLGAVADGQYLRRSGSTVVGGSPAGGGDPPWYGVLYSNQNDCDPREMIREWNMLSVAGPTPTGITASLARCIMFTPPANITVNRIRLFGVGSTTNLYKFAIYAVGAGNAKLWDSGTVTTAANTWLNIATGLPITLTAGTRYWFCVTAVTTGTTAGFRSMAAPLGTTFWGAAAAPIGALSLSLPVCAQFAVSVGVFPATLPAVAAAAYSGGTTGSVPFALLDNTI